MTPERWRTIQEVFAAATERDAALRPTFLEEACRNDPELRREVESLLSSLGTASPSFLESPAIEGVPALPPTSGAVGKGTRLGPYEILASLGSGGMGEVYRARDERLGREVAIKVLPAEWSSDASRVKRFEQEARSASALNHPNIVTVYDTGSSDGVAWIAMERVDGLTLRELVSGPLAIKRLLPIATQVADGLAKAHEAGIVHRDLKPENVMVTRDGLVKILDFGLAKLTSIGSGSGEGSRLPTMTGTTPGVVLGTVGYMSPEQASGERVDFRSDQFSFGSILYEMVTGRRAFQGKTAIDVLGAILNEEPQSIASVIPQAPTPLRWIVERCLAKDPRQRYSSTEDLARDLAKLRDHLSEATSGVAPAASKPRRRVLAGLLLGASALAIAAVSLLRPRQPATEPRPIRFSIRPPPNRNFGGGYHNFAFSPDGSQLAYRNNPREGAPTIWLRPLSESEGRTIPGTEGVDSLFWSPDGRSIAFFTADKLWRVDLSGGAPVAICDVNEHLANVGTWGAGGQIAFAPIRGEAIYRVSTSGGKPVPIVKADRGRGETKVLWPWFLPDGKSFLYLLREENGAGSLMISPAEGPPRRLIPMLSRFEYVDPGYLVFVRDGLLIAQRFDPRGGALSGEPLAIADSVRYSLKDGFAGFATSRNGSVAFRNRSAHRTQMAWFDRAGRSVDSLETLAAVGQPGESNDVAIDPDGRRVLFDRTLPKTRAHNLWILDLERRVENRVTSDPTDERSGRWLPDGKSIVYTAEAGGLVQLRRRDLATGRVEALLPYGEDEQAGAVAPGGTQLTYVTLTDQGKAEMGLVSLSGDHKTSTLARATGFDEAGGYSPDGRAMLFAWGNPGSEEIYVAPSARPGERIQITSGGTVHGVALWSRDSSEIFYLSPSRQLISVPVRTTPSLSVGKPSALFTIKEDAAWDTFDVSPDGKRFLAVFSAGPSEEPPIDVVLNWTAAVAAQSGPGR